MPTAVVIGAGPGLGLSIARRFGREGYKIALISRRPERHTRFVRELAGVGIEAAAFGADVRDTERLGEALEQVVVKFGEIDFVYYGPSPHNVAEAQKAVDEIVGADVVDAMGVVYPAADVVAKVLPSMLERKSGAFLFTSAISAVIPVPALGAMTVPAAAARNYAVNLNAALAPHGVYAGVLLIGGLIDGSDIQTGMASQSSDSTYLLDPDRIAETAWDLVTRRKTAEALITPGRNGVGLILLLIARLLRVMTRSARPRKKR
jgi:NADP-dependent 3-hydroxy acid dehydrogenase YdfG